MSHIPTTVRYSPYRSRAVAYPSAQLQTWASRGPAAEVIPPQAFAYATPHNHQATFCTTPGRGSLFNQHPSLYSFARPRSTQARSHHHIPVQLGGQALAYYIKGGSSGQTPFNPPHYARHVNVPVNPPHTGSGGSRSLRPSYNLPMANIPDNPRQSLAPANFHPAQNSHQGHQEMTSLPQMAQSPGACAFQPSFQATIPSQQFPPKQDLSKLSTTTAQPSPPASMVFYEDASSTNSSSAHEETGSKGALSLTATCPLPKCDQSCGRPQESERHFRELHLPHDIYCQEDGCDWTGNRRYALQSHIKGKHPSVPLPDQESSAIYDSKTLAKRLFNEEIGVEEAMHKARSLFEEKARSVGKQGLWRQMRGL